jgi:hypothetical protein
MRQVRAVWQLADLIFISAATGEPVGDAFAAFVDSTDPRTPATKRPVGLCGHALTHPRPQCQTRPETHGPARCGRWCNGPCDAPPWRRLPRPQQGSCAAVVVAAGGSCGGTRRRRTACSSSWTTMAPEARRQRLPHCGYARGDGGGAAPSVAADTERGACGHCRGPGAPQGHAAPRPVCCQRRLPLQVGAVAATGRVRGSGVRRGSPRAQAHSGRRMGRPRALVRDLPALLMRSPAGNDVLPLAARLLAGEPAAVSDLARRLNLPWLDVLAATLLYVNPTAKSYEMPCVRSRASGVGWRVA